MLPTITVDVGTTSVKLCAFDAAGMILAEHRFATPTVIGPVDAGAAHALAPTGETYDVELLVGGIDGFVRALPVAVRAAVRRVAIAGVGESGALVRADGSLASPIILWHDQRGAMALQRLTSEQRDELWERTGLPFSANYGISKVAWAVEHATDAEDAVWCNVSEYLAARMTGQRWAERSLASRTMALDLGTGTWSPEVCAMFGLDTDRFPPIRSAAEGSPVALPYADAVGLPEDVVVHVAGHDHMVGAVGAGLRPGELLNSTGTTEGLLVLRDDPALDQRTRDAKLANGFACTAGLRTVFASIPTGGSAFATLQSLLDMTPGRLAEIVDELHGRWLAGDVDLDALPLVLPTFRGSPPPTKNPAARGIVAGIGNATTAADIVLGTFLGLALQFRDVVDLFPERPAVVEAIGPVTRNPLWIQLKADVLDLPVSVVRADEVVSRGAQLIASGMGDEVPGGPTSVVETIAPMHADRVSAWIERIRPTWARLKDMAA